MQFSSTYREFRGVLQEYETTNILEELEKDGISRTVQMACEIVAIDENTRYRGRHACQGCSILLADILNEMGNVKLFGVKMR